MIDLKELLHARGLPNIPRKTKLVRHHGAEQDIDTLLAHRQIDTYQANQARPVFKNCSHIVSFTGRSYAHALFQGVYQVCDVQHNPTRNWPGDYIFGDRRPGAYWYDLRRLSGFEDLEGRVVINWGKSPRMWHQWLSSREVVEILPPDYVADFPGYEDVLLSFDELKRIFSNPLSNREWLRALGSVAGVYLISDTSSGKQYVGSAYGRDGIRGRWQNYADSGHGGNKLLKELLTKDPSAARYFQFSILRVMPCTLTADEILESEQCYKRKLGSRAYGLNSN